MNLSENWPQVFGLTTVISGIFLTWALNRRKDKRDSMSSAALKLVDGSQDLVEMMQGLLNPLRDRIGSLETSNTELAAQVDELDCRVRESNLRIADLSREVGHLISYVVRQREQIVALGGEPEPVPEHLKHLEIE